MYMNVWKGWLLIMISYCWAGAVFGQGAAFTEAAPVWPVGMETEKNMTVHFRSVVVPGDEKEFTLFITASSAYRAFVNGNFLAHGPCVAAHGFYRQDQYSFEHLLKPGENIISIEVAGYNMPSFYLLDQPSFLQAEIRAGEKIIAATGAEGKDFEASISGQRKRETPRYSHARPNTEFYMLDSRYSDWRINADADFPTVPLGITAEKKIISRDVHYPDYSIIRMVGNIGDTIYRFPYNATGFIGFEVEVSEPTELTIYFDELLKDQDVDHLRLVCQNYIVYQLEPGNYTLESFEPYTLQYVKPVITKGRAITRNWYIRQYVGADVSGSSFTTSDERLNRIFEASRETLRQNALDVLTDCPSRERGPWLGDGYFTARAALTISGNARVEKNFFQNYLLPDSFPDVPEGMVPMCYPCDHPNELFIPNWAMWFVIQLEEYFHRSGDAEMIAGMRQRVTDLIGYFNKFRNEDGLLENLEKWVFIDWSTANDFTAGVNYPSNMQFARVLEAAGNLYHNPEWKEQARKIRQVVLDQSFDGSLFHDHALRREGLLELQPATTEACQYYAFYFDLATPASFPGLWKIVKEELGPKRYLPGYPNPYPEIALSNTFMGEYFRMELLCRYNLVPQFIGENTENLMRQVKLTGTFWEQQYRTLRTSCSHGFATHVAYLYRRAIAGVDEIDVARKKLSVVFRKTGLEWCRYSVPLVDGNLDISWEIKNKTLRYKIHIPEGYELDIKNESGMRAKRIH